MSGPRLPVGVEKASVPHIQQHAHRARAIRPHRRALLFVGMLFLVLASLLLSTEGLAFPFALRGDVHDGDAVDLYGRKNGSDPYFGKTLAPSNYTVVTGLFRQDDPDLDEKEYDMLKDSFGLLDKSDNRWRKFERYITDLNKNADEHTTYKVIYIARHGQGYHNVAESLYGTPAWNCYWSLLYGDGNMTWGPDPLLTPLGEEQAAAANAGWKEQLAAGAPLPQVLYSSPFRRAASTLDITWKDILLDKGFVPAIKEQWRENIGLHTCDERSNKSLIQDTYPHFAFEPSFTEHDPYWDATYIETETQRAVRLRMAINDLFATDSRTFISITCHSGVINAFFLATGHRKFSVQTGGFVPVVLKAVSHPTATFAPITRGQSGTAPACTEDPAPASLMTGSASVTVQPTWYPSCTAAEHEEPEVGCELKGAVTGTWAGAATPAPASSAEN